MKPKYVSVGNIFIDDIVLPDGRTFMGTLGGAGTHALIGMRVWSKSLGLTAFAGADLPHSFREQLTNMGVDLQGIHIIEGLETNHAWQLYEPDGRRIEIFRSEQSDFFSNALDFDDIPIPYYHASGYHLYWAKESAELPRFINQLRRVNPTAALVWEPAFHHIHTQIKELRAALAHVDIFSPDEEAVYAMTDTKDVESAMARLLEWGAPAVAIRMGAKGSLLGTTQGEWWQIPAVPAQVVDVTGAGNAYCGGLVVGLAKGEQVAEAALRGTVSASFAIEQFGMPSFDSTQQAEAENRLSWARIHTKRLK